MASFRVSENAADMCSNCGQSSIPARTSEALRVIGFEQYHDAGQQGIGSGCGSCQLADPVTMAAADAGPQLPHSYLSGADEASITGSATRHAAFSAAARVESADVPTL